MKAFFPFLFFISVLFGDVKSTDGKIDFRPDSNQVQMRLNQTGLAIGSLNPSANLHVEGNVLIENGSLGIGINNPTSNLSVQGSVEYSAQSISSNATLAEHSYVFVDTSAQDIKLYLPFGDTEGRVYYIKKVSPSNNIFLTGDVIDELDYVLMSANTTSLPYLSLIDNGTSWSILSSSDTNIENGNSSDNLIIWWRFDESSGFTVEDSSSNSKTGLLKPSSLVPGQFGSALELNGSDHYVDIPDDPSLRVTGNYTLSAWVKRDNTGLQTIISKKATWTDFEGYELETGPNFIRVVGANSSVITSAAIADWDNSVWHHAVGVVDGTSVTFYLDGVDVSNGGTLTEVTKSTQGLRLGARSGNSIQELEGCLDDVRIYNKSLSSAEVAQVYANSTTVSSSNLVGWWKLDAISSTNTILDSSSESNNGTLIPDDEVGPSFVTGKLANAIELDGSDDFVKHSTLGISGNAARTVMCWVKVDSYTNAGGVWHMGTTGVNFNDFSLETSTTSGEFRVNLWTGDFTFTIANVNSWHHIAVRCDRLNVEAYVDGALVNSNSVPNLSTPDTGVRIGGLRADSTGTFFDGQIDDFRVYSKDLSAAEILQIYNDTK